MAHPFPIHWWKLIWPCVVSAVKLGASLLILKDMTDLHMTIARSSSVPVVCLLGAHEEFGGTTLAAAEGTGLLPVPKLPVTRDRRGPKPLSAPQRVQLPLVYSQGCGESRPSGS